MFLEKGEEAVFLPMGNVTLKASADMKTVKGELAKLDQAPPADLMQVYSKVGNTVSKPFADQKSLKDNLGDHHEIAIARLEIEEEKDHKDDISFTVRVWNPHTWSLHEPVEVKSRLGSSPTKLAVKFYEIVKRYTPFTPAAGAPAGADAKSASPSDPVAEAAANVRFARLPQPKYFLDDHSRVQSMYWQKLQDSNQHYPKITVEMYPLNLQKGLLVAIRHIRIPDAPSKPPAPPAAAAPAPASSAAAASAPASSSSSPAAAPAAAPASSASSSSSS